MNFLRKPIVAILLAVILVFSSTVLSVNLRLNPQCKAVSAVFYESDGIADQLRLLCDASDGLIQIADSYELDTYDVSVMTDGLRNTSRSETPEELYVRYQALNSSLRSLSLSLQRTTLSENDSRTVEALSASVYNAQIAIDSAAYNTQVSDFLQTTLRFPAEFMARLSGVQVPVLFA